MSDLRHTRLNLSFIFWIAIDFQNNLKENIFPLRKQYSKLHLNEIF